jgi:predicted nucleotidyltransferase
MRTRSPHCVTSERAQNRLECRMADKGFESIKRAVVRCVSRRKEIQAAYIFGSAATGRMRPGSDVDVAVLVDGSIRGSRMSRYRLALMADLASALQRLDVDLVLLNQANPLLAHRVLSKGKLVFERSASARVRFQVQTANRYFDLIPMFETQLRYLKKQAREDRIVG